MVPVLTQPVSFNDFIQWYPNTEIRYELHDGVIVEMPKPTGKHSNVTSFLIESPTFPELNLTAQQVFRAGK